MKRQKHELFLLAGLLWMFAGFMILSTGLTAWSKTHSLVVNVLALAIYLLFYLFVFSKLVHKHHHRIVNDPNDTLEWWKFFDKKGYFIMGGMMALGIILRSSHALPTIFFAFFYTGLGFALASCGVRFLFLYHRYKPAK